jgi:hypothetical protein
VCSALLLLAVGLLWLRFNVAPGRTGVPFPLDFLTYFVPMTDWVARRLRAGELPLWNPHACSGMPLLATLQVGVFYPGSWPAIWLPTERILRRAPVSAPGVRYRRPGSSSSSGFLAIASPAS